MLRGLATRAGVASREDKWRLYQRLFPPRRGERVLDVGASHWTDLQRENWFLKRYPYPEQVTAVALSHGDSIAAAFPGVSVVEADGRDLPFGNGAFDVVHSNAVIEHVGERREQERFVKELARVANRGFLTTPNRWFPIESHSLVPFAHWLPDPLAWRIVKACGYEGERAWLLGPRAFLSLVPRGAAKPTLHRMRMAGLTATLVVTFGESEPVTHRATADGVAPAAEVERTGSGARR